ncbi:TPA: BppU family phage baseplate upper protein, partial [Clostridium perfringens]
MKEIIVNVDNYNENSIKTIEGDNLSEVYKIYICKNKRRIDLTNKIAIMAYVNEYGNKKSNILALNITNASQGEIELPITNVISSENGVYACQVAIYGENNSLEQTAPFS